jgi:hypothetical protein
MVRSGVKITDRQGRTDNKLVRKDCGSQKRKEIFCKSTGTKWK